MGEETKKDPQTIIMRNELGGKEIEIDFSEYEKIQTLCIQGEKIQAIKYLRELENLALRDAKDIIEYEFY